MLAALIPNGSALRKVCVSPGSGFGKAGSVKTKPNPKVWRGLGRAQRASPASDCAAYLPTRSATLSLRVLVPGSLAVP